MGIQVSRIEREFILKKVLKKGSNISILSNRREFKGKIKTFDESHIILNCSEDDLVLYKVNDEVDVFFVFENNYHTFSSKILEINMNLLILHQPKIMYKNLQREYERIKNKEDLTIYFTIKGKKIYLNFPKTDIYRPLETPEISNRYNSASIKILIQDFRKKMKHSVSDNKIIIMRDKALETFEEIIMAKTGKIIWLPIVEDGLIKHNIYTGNIILTQNEYEKHEKDAGIEKSVTMDKIEKLIKDKVDGGYYSQLYCPLLYNEYFAGYIFIYNTKDKKKEIDIQILHYVYQFSKVLCYSLKQNNYFKLKRSQDYKYNGPIIDISASGLLFAHSGKNISLELPLLSKLNITLKIKEKKINIGCQILRKFKDKETFYFGLKYKEIVPSDFKYLYKFLYGKPYSVTQINQYDKSFFP